MNQKKIGGTKKKVTDALAMLLMIIVFCAFMFPFVMVIINSLKQKRDIIKSPFSWLFTIKGLSFDNFVKAFNQMNFLNAFKNSLVVTVTATVLVTVLAAMLADPSCQKKVLVLVQPVRNAVIHQNVESWVQQHYLQHAACGGVLALDVPRVLK